MKTIILLLAFAFQGANAQTSPTSPYCNNTAIQTVGYNTGSDHLTNTVPLFLCYKNTVGECLYNTTRPYSATGAWNTGCPKSVAGDNCCAKPTTEGCCVTLSAGATASSAAMISCGLNKNDVTCSRDAAHKCGWTTNCATPSPTPKGTDGKCCLRNDPKSGFNCAALDAPTMAAINTPGVSLSDALKMTCQRQFTANDHYCRWDTSNPECMPKQKDPCEAKGMFSVKGDKLNLPNEEILCCSTKNPKEEMLSGKKVCCEVIKRARN